jgi:hypothetical protein
MTMVDYMERETAIKAIEKADCAVIADDAESCKTDYLREIIKSVPAADVAPVVHGRWVFGGDGCVICSKCNEEESNDNHRNFCPNCGAKMDGGADHEDD